MGVVQDQESSNTLQWSPVVSIYNISVFVPTYLLLLYYIEDLSHWGSHTPFQ